MKSKIKKHVRLLFLVLCIILTTCIIMGYFVLKSEYRRDLIKTSIRFPIPIVEAGQAGFYVAKEKGYFAVEGLDVTFHHSTPIIGPVKAVSTEIDDFGMIGGLDALLVARGKGRDLKAVAILHKNAEFVALFSLKDSGIKTAADLKGKKVGFFYGHISEDFIHSYLKKEDVTVNEVGMKYYDYDRLTSGDVDVIPGFKATVLPDMEAKGIEVNIIDPAVSGTTMQGYTIFVTDEFAKEKPEIIVKFLRATLKGYIDSVINPQEAVEMLIKYDPSLSLSTELKRIPYYNAPMSSEPYGYMDERMFKETYNRLNEQGLIGTQYNPIDAFDSSFVDKADVKGSSLK